MGRPDCRILQVPQTTRIEFANQFTPPAGLRAEMGKEYTFHNLRTQLNRHLFAGRRPD